jgi:hypothetical protein
LGYLDFNGPYAQESGAIFRRLLPPDLKRRYGPDHVLMRMTGLPIRLSRANCFHFTFPQFAEIHFPVNSLDMVAFPEFTCMIVELLMFSRESATAFITPLRTSRPEH